MGVAAAPSLEAVFGVAAAAGSDLSAELEAQKLVTFDPSARNEIQDQIISIHRQSSPFYLTSKAALLLHVFGAVCYRRGPGRQDCGDTGGLLLLLL